MKGAVTGRVWIPKLLSMNVQHALTRCSPEQDLTILQEKKEEYLEYGSSGALEAGSR